MQEKNVLLCIFFHPRNCPSAQVPWHRLQPVLWRAQESSNAALSNRSSHRSNNSPPLRLRNSLLHAYAKLRLPFFSLVRIRIQSRSRSRRREVFLSPPLHPSLCTLRLSVWLLFFGLRPSSLPAPYHHRRLLPDSSRPRPSTQPRWPVGRLRGRQSHIED